ncbi:Uncharacterized conserved protein YbbK, DUF523 family [Caloramator quimbayensis]|uniref:Uncharacterized conserved protein YbbK, DUF523 family n=1 Tax=Caloramator quimbayensis TaxID=1147123 RepID=A0A1T4Y1S7_9CLOT|nr:DUF523 domain-containing protein [Caloramator quimbayensis]SKA95726.1 Uncharacterized conserved protein YbbK, DUF523 family [Caloramator quimbayensis]
MILVSSCLLGLDTKYNGENNAKELLIEYSRYGKFIPICPEQLGGLSTPRAPSEIAGGSGEDVLKGLCRVLSESGTDETNQYIKGAKEVIKIVKIFPVKAAILKQRSPSCGSMQIYDGSFSGKVRDGAGVTAVLLKEYGIPVYSEEEINRDILEKLIFE